MIRKVVSRILICIALYILMYADRSTRTLDIGVSVCILLMFEISLLVENKWIEIPVLIIPFIVTFVMIYTSGALQSYRYAGLLLVFSFGVLQYTGNNELEKSRKKVHMVRDQEAEYSKKLMWANRHLRMEQDQEIHMATLAERSRIAREIHDNVGHMLSRSIILLGAIRTVNKDESLEKNLSTLSDTLDEAMEEMRTSVHGIHDDSIDLKKNILDIISDIPERFSVERDLDIGQDLNGKCVLALIAICREAVSNIERHSNGNKIQVTVHEHPGFVSMTIHDNGCVSDATKKMLERNEDTGIGLTNIRNRVEELNGNVLISGESGFKIFVTIPKS